MFWKKKKQPSLNDDMRETLFGDQPLEVWAGHDHVLEPWASFANVKECLDSSKKEKAIERLKAIISQEDLESRHYLQAYHFLKQLGHTDESLKKLYGVVLEVGLKKNQYDLLAAYEDLTARYYNYAGSAIIWEHPDDSVDQEINDLLELGGEILEHIGPWEGPRLMPVKKGMVRINLLTSSGLHFGEGSMNAMDRDPLGGALFNAGFRLMDKLMARTKVNGPE